MRLDRRTLIQSGAALALSGCSPADGPDAHAAAAAPPSIALKRLLDCPVGTCLMTPELQDPAFVALVQQQFSQITPEWELKMERVLKADGSLDFSAADAIASFCRANGMALHGTTLVWYAQDPQRFAELSSDRAVFEKAYRDYITAVMQRYAGLARGWDVVNEAVSETGDGYRGGIWERVLGEDYARIAFETAHEADPKALLFLNDYNLETRPAKLDKFQRMLERLLRSGAPVSGIGTQSHIPADLPDGQAKVAIRALARFGLPIHVSELDVTTRLTKAFPLQSREQKLAAQARRFAEMAEAFMELPTAQRYAFTIWGARDQDSWLRRAPNNGDGSDLPLAFDDQGGAKPAFEAMRDVFTRRAHKKKYSQPEG